MSASAAPRSTSDPQRGTSERSHEVPYPGLRPFRPDEEALFFGRERQVDRMIDKLASHRFLAVVGTSGGGKSSLVNCGLRPALHRGLMADAGSSWRVAQFRPSANPVRALAQALAAVLFEDDDDRAMLDSIVEATLHTSSLGVLDLYAQARLHPETNLLIVVDQFEELFRYHREDTDGDAEATGVSSAAAAFVRLLLEARTHQRLHVVITMRSDFLGDCAQFRGLAEAINDGQYLVPRLTRDETRAAITGPVSVVGDVLDPVLVTQLLNDVGDSPDQLSILQHALNRTWAHWQNEGGAIGPVSLANYDAIGGMRRALDLHAEKAYGELESERLKLVCERVFRTLTDRGSDARGVRRPTPFASLCAITAATEVEVRRVLAAFRKASRSFVMPPINEVITPDTMIDISHESLMRVWVRLKGWSQQEAESAQDYVRLADTALLHKVGNASLWREAELANALTWQRMNEPNAAWAQQHRGEFTQAMSFLQLAQQTERVSVATAHANKRWVRLRKIAAVATVLILVLWVLLGENSTMFSGDKETAYGLLALLLFGILVFWLAGEFLYRPFKRDSLLRKQAAAEQFTHTVESRSPARSRVMARRAVTWVVLPFVVLLSAGFALSAWYQNSVLEQRTHVAEDRLHAAVELLSAAALTDSAPRPDSARGTSADQVAQDSLRLARFCIAGDCQDSVPKLRRALIAFDSLRVLVDTLAGWEQHTPDELGWGMWRGPRLLANARSRWMDAYHVAFQDSLDSRMAAALRDVPTLRKYVDYTEVYETLRAFLLLRDAKTAGSHQQFLGRVLLQLTQSVQGDVQSAALQRRQLDYFVALHASGAVAARNTIALDTALVRSARAELLRWTDGYTPVDRAIFMALVAAAEAKVKSVSLDTAVLSSFAPTFISGVSGAYTRDGRRFIERALRGDLDSILLQEAWVMGDSITISAAAYDPQQIMRYYDGTFPWWWSKYLEALIVPPAADLRDASRMMHRLTTGRSSLQTLLLFLDEHGVNSQAGKPGSVALASLWPASPSPGSYGGAMIALRKALDSLQVGPGLEGDDAFAARHASATGAAKRATLAQQALYGNPLNLDDERGDKRDAMINRILNVPIITVTDVLERTDPLKKRRAERK